MAETLDEAALAELTIDWHWPRRKPDAEDDDATTDEDTPVRIDVLDNDENAYGIIRIEDTWLTWNGPESVTLQSGAEVTRKGDYLVYDPRPAFQHLNDGDTAEDSFTYTVFGYGTDTAEVTVEIKGITDDPDDNQAPVAYNDFARLPSYYWWHGDPGPVPLDPIQAAGDTTAALTDSAIGDDPVYTTLAIGEEGDPFPYNDSVRIDVLANDYDPDEGDELSVATISTLKGDTVSVDPGDVVDLPSGAKVRVNEDGSLTYSKGIFKYIDPAILPASEDAVTVVANADGSSDFVSTEAVQLPETSSTFWPVLADVFYYTAEDEHGAESNKASVTVYRDIWPYILEAEPATDPVGTLAGEGDTLLA